MAQVPVDFNGLKGLGDQWYDASYSWLLDKGVPGYLATICAGFTVATNMILPVTMAVLVQGALGVGAFFASSVLSVISSARETNKGDFNQVIASSVNELLGTNVSPDQLNGGSGGATDMETNRVLGDALLSSLEQAFGANTEITPENGAENARKFAGFGVNFATSQAFLSILAEASTLGLLKEFHELPDGLLQALGLGRLQRLALQPLIRNCVQQPYDLFLKKQLRPDRLADSQYVRALARGDFDEPYVRERLAEKGFPNDEVDALIHEYTAKLATSDLAILIRYGDITEDQALQQLQDQGIDGEIAKQTLRAVLASQADGRVTIYVNKIAQQRLDGLITQEQFSYLLDQVPWTTEQKQWERDIVGAIAELPRKRITFAQLKEAVVKGHVDFGYVDQWLIYEGYGDDDQLVLTMEIIDAMHDAAAKVAAKAATHAKVTSKGKTAPPALQP